MSSLVGEETWKIVVEGAKASGHIILCNGPPERPYGFSIYQDKAHPLIRKAIIKIDEGEKCFCCKNVRWYIFYQWIFNEELKDEKKSLGAFQAICGECFDKL